MAIIRVFDDEQQRVWDRWVKSRLPVIRDLCERFPPTKLYRIKETGQRVTIAAYNEEGTLRVNVSGEYNLVIHEIDVFGVKPDSLEECDLPGPEELAGALLTEPGDIEGFTDFIRPAVLAGRKRREAKES